MYGDLAIKLTKEAIRQKSLQKYETDITREIKFETNHLLSQKTEDQTFTAIAQIVSQRNKRCLLSYHYDRMYKIMSIVWNKRCDGGGSKYPNKELKRKLSVDEVDFYMDYARAVFMDYVDLTGNLYTTPPFSLFVEVRALCDVEVENCDGDGVLSVKKGETVYMKREDAELLVEKGLLVQVVTNGL